MILAGMLLVLGAASRGAEDRRYLDGKLGLLLNASALRDSAPETWVGLAQAAGARHIVADATSTTEGIADLAAACRRANLRLGIRCRADVDAIRSVLARAGE